VEFIEQLRDNEGDHEHRQLPFEQLADRQVVNELVHFVLPPALAILTQVIYQTSLVEMFYYWFIRHAIAHDPARQENIVKKPAPPPPAHPPPDDPGRRFRETEDVDEASPALAAKKRLEALEAIKRGQSNTGEQSNGQESGEEKTGSQDQGSKK
jgi:hypothetical protein